MSDHDLLMVIAVAGVVGALASCATASAAQAIKIAVDEHLNPPSLDLDESDDDET